MGLELGNLLGAAANLTTAASQEKTLKSFLANINSFGLQVQNNFEVNFSGLEDITFFVQSITIPGVKQNFGDVYFDGRLVDVPYNHEFEHEFSVSVINDAQGYIYSAIQNFIMSDSTSTMVNSGYTMTVKALTGDSKYKGSLYTLKGVRFESLGPLSYGYNQNDISTFDLGLKCIEVTATPGGLGKVAGVLGAATSLLG